MARRVRKAANKGQGVQSPLPLKPREQEQGFPSCVICGKVGSFDKVYSGLFGGPVHTGCWDQAMKERS